LWPEQEGWFGSPGFASLILVSRDSTTTGLLLQLRGVYYLLSLEEGRHNLLAMAGC